MYEELGILKQRNTKTTFNVQRKNKDFQLQLLSKLKRIAAYKQLPH